MADRPSLFSASMVQALLAGRKTQTRRLLPLGSPPKDSGKHVVKQLIRPFDAPAFYQYEWRSKYGVFCGVVKLRINIGDRLYVREAWRTHAMFDAIAPRDLQTSSIHYIADGEIDSGKYRQAMHMPRRLSRLTLIVKDVRVERLQDISEKDALAEGIQKIGRFYGLPDSDWDTASTTSAIDAYGALWDHINGADAWAENPWITAISFDVVKQNIDEVAA
ncbi:hypothetical protein FHS21_001285 [Phyllobacterium trifolii]|uniref:Uncharacterized protein n=1 Tax=Phyllobacterium trifolii TaxID=300193 RepID=A0A839U4A6_9HYPH|nr:hypothetical protein [Phyllobacterium trifolii]MBB3144884.1 hypothetical protein [Phyllobacterium trifolii]